LQPLWRLLLRHLSVGLSDAAAGGLLAGKPHANPHHAAGMATGPDLRGTVMAADREAVHRTRSAVHPCAGSCAVRSHGRADPACSAMRERPRRATTIPRAAPSSG